MPERAASDPAAQDPPRARRRLNTKWWLIAGAGALSVVTLAAAATAWLWPAAAPAKKPGAAAVAASAAAASAAAEPSPSAHVAAASAAASAPGAEAVAMPIADGGAEAHPALSGTDEDPLDHLRRRLDQKLGAHSLRTTSTPGELHLVTKAGKVVTEPAPLGGGTVQWGYEGKHGPQAWARLDAGFSACATGRRQSPIDIRDGVAVDLEAPAFSYKASAFSVIDTGHTVQVNVGAGNSFALRGKRWALRSLHFHRPSEERIDGKRFDMAVHLVHADEAGNLAVVAVLLQRGAAQPLLRAVWNDLPLEKHEEVQGRAALDLNRLLPQGRRYYTYMGSLSTPPCSEGVLWLVMREPVAVAASDVSIFARMYAMNARPIQQANGRLIKQSN